MRGARLVPIVTTGLLLILALAPLASASVVSVERELAVSYDSRLTPDSTINLASNSAATNYETWSDFTNVTEGAWVGGGLPESLAELDQAGEDGTLVIGHTARFQADTVMSGASVGWARSPFVNSTLNSNTTMDIYRVENPKQASLIAGDPITGAALPDDIIDTTAEFNATGAQGITGADSGQIEHTGINSNYRGKWNGNGEIGLAQTNGQYSTIEEPLGLWHLGESTGATARDDAPGGGWPGSLQGDTAWSTSGIEGACLDFDGDSDYLLFGDLDVDTTMSFSIWVRWEGSPSGERYIAFKSSSWYLRLEPNEILRFVTFGLGDNVLETTDTLTQNIWYHVAVTVAADLTKSIYIDGALSVSESGVSGTLTQNSNDLELGFHGGTAFDGKLDEASLYDTTLSGADVLALTRRFIDEGRYQTPWQNPGPSLFDSLDFDYNQPAPLWSSIDKVELYGSNTGAGEVVSGTLEFTWNDGFQYNLAEGNHTISVSNGRPDPRVFSYWGLAFYFEADTAENDTATVFKITSHYSAPGIPNEVGVHPLAHPILIWTWDYNASRDPDKYQVYQDRQYLRFQAPIYPDIDYYFIFQAEVTDDHLGGTSKPDLYLSLSDIGDNSIHNTDIVSYSSAGGWYNTTLPGVDPGVSFLFTEGMGYHTRGLQLLNMTTGDAGLANSDYLEWWVELPAPVLTLGGEFLTYMMPWIADQNITVALTITGYQLDGTPIGIVEDETQNITDFVISSRGDAAIDSSILLKFEMIFGNGSDFPFPLVLTEINPFIWDRNSDFSEANYTRNKVDIYRQGVLTDRWSFIPYMAVEITLGSWVNIQPEVIHYEQPLSVGAIDIPVTRHDDRSTLEVLGSLTDTAITGALKGTGKALNYVTFGAIPESILADTYQAAKDWVASTVIIPAWGFYSAVNDGIVSFENLILPKIEATITFLHETWQRYGELIMGVIAWAIAIPIIVILVHNIYTLAMQLRAFAHALASGFPRPGNKEGIKWWREVKDPPKLIPSFRSLLS